LILLAVTVIGFPFAIWKYVSWLFVQQEVLFTDKSIARPSAAAPSWSAATGGTPTPRRRVSRFWRPSPAPSS